MLKSFDTKKKIRINNKAIFRSKFVRCDGLSFLFVPTFFLIIIIIIQINQHFLVGLEIL